MLQFAVEDVGDNFHVAMAVGAEAGSRRHAIVINDSQ